MEFACNNFRNYLKNQPIDKDYDAKSVGKENNIYFLSYKRF